MKSILLLTLAATCTAQADLVMVSRESRIEVMRWYQGNLTQHSIYTYTQPGFWSHGDAHLSSTGPWGATADLRSLGYSSLNSYGTQDNVFRFVFDVTEAHTFQVTGEIGVGGGFASFSFEGLPTAYSVSLTSTGGGSGSSAPISLSGTLLPGRYEIEMRVFAGGLTIARGDFAFFAQVPAPGAAAVFALLPLLAARRRR
jgi:hypothetical protein